ncbi:MAG: hypothetical protein IT228_13445 [Flavobacteriales bacterium]|nr:hypothetical protein [Flavobacteriales bacterium]NUQ13696.1 hypothetical protein [Flavobacteriales bacterium]
MRRGSLGLCILLMGCHCRQQGTAGTAATTVQDVQDVPHVLVYRTRSDTRGLVPVTLSEDRSRIVAYPHPGDIDPVRSAPVELAGGWLLDRRGITAQVAFLGTTYAAYAKLEQAPSLEEMMAGIADRDPLMDLCDCGPRTAFKDVEAEVGAYAARNEIHRRCKRIR